MRASLSHGLEGAAGGGVGVVACLAIVRGWAVGECKSVRGCAPPLSLPCERAGLKRARVHDCVVAVYRFMRLSDAAQSPRSGNRCAPLQPRLQVPARLNVRTSRPVLSAVN